MAEHEVYADAGMRLATALRNGTTLLIGDQQLV